MLIIDLTSAGERSLEPVRLRCCRLRPHALDPVCDVERFLRSGPDDDIGGACGREPPEVDPDIDLPVGARPAVMNMAEELDRPLPCAVPA